MDDTLEFVNQSPEQTPSCGSGSHLECTGTINPECQCVQDKTDYVPWILGGLGVVLLGGLAVSAYRAYKGMPEPGTVWAQSGAMTTFPLREPSNIKWTVRCVNEGLGTSHFTGTFSTEEEAIAYAQQQANRSRKFATYEVWIGKPRNPIDPTKHFYRGIY